MQLKFVVPVKLPVLFPWQSKVVDPVNQSLHHVYIVVLFIHICSCPRYSWNTACWTLINNLSTFRQYICFSLLHIWSQPFLLKRAWVNDMIKILFTVLLFNITYIGFEEWFDKNHWTKWNPFGIYYIIFLSPDFFATVFSSEFWTRSDSLLFYLSNEPEIKLKEKCMSTP